ncbi:sensor histidine kinase [Sphingomonas sp.]|uniref:sensor histidine kinase n=1 Tax=Sphingomonas sp. TaxID=28214 RepID=UPI002DD6A1DD|nr:histidine kinase [Sphingomonas sp.]
MADHRPSTGSARFTHRIAAVTILLFWAAQFSLLTTQRLVFGAEDDASFYVARLLVAAVGVLLSFVMLRFHVATRGRSLAQRLGFAVIAALAGAALHAFANYWLFRLLVPKDTMAEAGLLMHLLAMLQWFWTYAAISGLLLAIVYSGEVRDHERRTAQLQREAHEAHVRALRYQLNPHFMFNTLNSIAALIGSGAVEPAERMVENLSDFLRAGLAIDPAEDIPLAKEIELQSTYLAIEAVRFPNRLVVDIDVPDAVRTVPVPSLIIQPLVENAVRHAVAPSIEPVRVTILAHAEGRRLRIRVRNGGPGGVGGRPAAPGTGVGLANVAERLRTRYGDDCGFAAGRMGDGGFEVTFAIPMEGQSA